jgi:hypothetical protein
VYWGTGTAHLLPRLLRLPDGTSRTSGPLFVSERKPVPARRPGPRDICPHTGRPRLGYDRCRVLLRNYTITNGADAWELHQFRHSAATHLGDKKVRCNSSWPRPGTSRPAPPCATSNPAARLSPRSPNSSTRPRAVTETERERAPSAPVKWSYLQVTSPLLRPWCVRP